MSEESNKAVVRAVLEAIDRQDLHAIEAHPGMSETVQYVPRMWEAFPDMRHTVEHQIAAGEMVATVATVRGTHLGSFMGRAPTSTEVSFLLLAMNRVVDGRVVLHYGLPDWMAVLGPLGMIPGLAPA